MKKNKCVGCIKSVGRIFFPTWNKHVGHNKHVGRNIFITYKSFLAVTAFSDIP